MPNTNVQAIRVANEKIRPAADKMGQLYNFYKALQAEANAEGWMTMFPNDSENVVDGSAVDGRAPITNADVRNFINCAGAFITFMEQAANANRDLALRIAVNPERF